MTETYKDKIKDVDLVEEIFKRGVLEGTKHSVPSPETTLRLSNIEKTLENMMDSFKGHSKKSEERIEEIVLEFREGMKDVKSLQEFLNNATFTKRFLLSTGGVVAGVVTFVLGTYLMVKSIFNGN